MAGTALVGALVQPVFALEVDREVMPRMTLGGRVIATADANSLDSNTAKESEFNVEDSSILMRFDKRMYEDGVAGAVFGLTDHDGEVKFHQLHAFYWNQDFAVKVGRTRLRNTIIEFPLIRDDDFLAYTHVGNTASNEEYDQFYAPQAAFDWFFDRKKQSLGVWSATRANGTGMTAPDGFDSYGLNYVFEQPEDLLYVNRIRHAGISLDRQKVTTTAGDEWMSAVIAGIDFNLNIDPRKTWSMGLQAISSNGIDGIVAADIVHTNTNVVSNRAKAMSNAFVASLRYTARPQLLTRWQAGLNVGYKDYSDVANATQMSIAPNFVYRLGQGVDVLAQFKYTDYDDGLGGGSDRAIQLGISFNLESVFNDTIGERDSILNLEHGYIK